MDFWCIDARISANGLGKELSNLMPYAFTFDEIECGGMEGFLQSLKLANPYRQKEVAALSGVVAYKVGQDYNYWQDDQTLYWKGTPYPRIGKSYNSLITRAYDACLDQNVNFIMTLVKSEDAIIEHSIGKVDPSKTVLTASEYIYHLYRLRARAQQMARRAIE